MNAPVGHPMIRRFPDLGRGPVSTEAVTSQSYFEAEREAVFKRAWLLLGRETELPCPGDFIVRRIEPWSSTVVVARDRDGHLHAMHDVCPHRGMHVCGRPQAGSRRSKNFTCQFHGWVFGMDGRVLDVPDREQYYDLDVASLRMPPVAVDTWQGFVFVNYQAEPEQSLADFLGELGEGYDGYFDDSFYVHAGTYVADMHMNYKFYYDSSVETLHAGYTHIQNNTGQNRESGTALYAVPEGVWFYGPHRSISVPIGLGERELALAERLGLEFGGATTPYDPRVQARPLPPRVNPGRLENWAFDVVEVFPNSLIFQSAALYAVLSMWPQALDRCRFTASIYMPAPANAAERVAIEYGLLSLRDVMREDLNMAEGCTDAVASGVLKAIQLSDQEIAVRHSYAMIDAAVQAWRASHEQG